jgi:hypothetical protein
MTVFDSKSGGQKASGRGADVFWNLMTILTLLATVVIGLLSLMIYQYPAARFNPFPPPTLAVRIALPTATPTLLKLPPTFTVAPTQTPLPTRTPVPPTLTASPTIVGAGTSLAVASTPDKEANYSFAFQSDPSAIDASVLYPDRDCKWMGVGGQVVDLQGRPVTGITVQLGGTLNNKPVDLTSLTGLATKYGEAGYEFELAKEPVASKSTLWVRLIDQARLPLSARVYVETFAECGRNLIILNFRQVR